MECQNYSDSKLAKDVQNYYFCCYVHNKMVDNNDCKKCKYYKFRD